MVSIPFYPHCGGLETATMNLSLELCRKGHNVKVITHTPSIEKDEFPFEVLRNPSFGEVFKAYKWCDIFCHQQISLKYVWPIFLLRKPWFVVYHQVFYQKGILGKIKKMFSHLSCNIAVSKTTAKGYGLKNPFVIYNTYNDNIFKTTNETTRRDFLFVGRMITGKGVYVLLEAFAKFKEKTASDYKLIYIGDGPELERLKEQAARMAIKEDVLFLGRKTPEEICEIQNQCKVQIVPSTRPYYEAFGIVVLEALASGCIVIGSDGDGIAEALGGNGYTYANGDVDDLASTLEQTAEFSGEECVSYRNNAKKWLETLTMEKVGMRYIEAFKSKCSVL